MANSTTDNAIIGIGLNSTSFDTPFAQAGNVYPQTPTSTISSYPLLGLTYVQALEQVFGGTETFDGSGAYQALTVSLAN